MRSAYLLIAASLAAVPTVARAEPEPMPARIGGVGGGALHMGKVRYEGGQVHPLLGIEAWGGYSPDGRVAYLVRVALGGDTDWNDAFTAIAIAARVWAPGGRLYIEPQLGMGSDEPPYDCGGPFNASDCGPGPQRGLLFGLTAGLELVHRPHVAVDLRAGFSKLDPPHYDDTEQLTVGLAITGF